MIASAILLPIVDRALAEDLSGGDLTSEATIPASCQASAYVVTREPIVACGSELFRLVFQRVDPSVRVFVDVEDGIHAPAGTRLWRAEGTARSILMAERTALNFTQRMCGIATIAHRYVAALPQGSKTRVVDTRKTTPGLRVLERYAVRVGGALNHRDCLGSAVLIKDNHIAIAGGIAPAVQRARRDAPHSSKVECEVESLHGVHEALDAGADIVLLDNFTLEEVAPAVTLCKGRALVEASGGITLERITELASAGVDVISVGALTHSVRASDLSLEIEVDGS